MQQRHLHQEIHSKWLCEYSQISNNNSTGRTNPLETPVKFNLSPFYTETFINLYICATLPRLPVCIKVTEAMWGFSFGGSSKGASDAKKHLCEKVR